MAGGARAEGSYISQNDLRVHFGLGAATRVDRLWVRWPNGLEEEWRDVPADQVLTLREGSGGRRVDGAAIRARLALPRALVGAARLARRRAVPAPAASPAPRPAPPPSASPVPVAIPRPALAAARARSTPDGPPPRSTRCARCPPRTRASRVLLGVALYHASDPLGAIAQLGAVLRRLPAGLPGAARGDAGAGAVAVPGGPHPGRDPLPGEDTRLRAGQLRARPTLLGMAYIQTRQPDAARAGLGARLPGASGVAGRAPAHRADDGARGAGRDGGGGAGGGPGQDPRLPQAQFLLGQTALFRGRLDEAIALFRKELEVSPGNAMAFYRLGDAYSRQRKWDEALDALQRSVWLNPYFSGPYVLMGKAYLGQGRPRGRGGHAAPRLSATTPTTRRRTTSWRQPLQRAGRTRGGDAGSSRSRRSCRPRCDR